jgi:hypothetical protein
MRGYGALCAAALVLLAAGPADALAGARPGYSLLELDGKNVKWGAPVRGTGATVTYALAADATVFPDARNCRSLVSPAGLAAASGVPMATFRGEVAMAFAAWSDVANIVFAPGDPATADIVIGAEGEPFGHAFTNVTRSASEGATATIARSVICLNPQGRWKVGFDGRLDVYDLRYTLEHEIGHAIGLDHPGVAGVLMDFRYREAFRVPQPADIAGAVLLYGPKGEPPMVASAGPEPAATAAGGAEVGFANPAN